MISSRIMLELRRILSLTLPHTQPISIDNIKTLSRIVQREATNLNNYLKLKSIVLLLAVVFKFDSNANLC